MEEQTQEQGDARVLNDSHATMAMGWLGAHLATRVDETTGALELPEPPEWLALWETALASTRAPAEAEFRAKRQSHRELARSVADVTEQGRTPTEIERLEIETMAQAHYEAYQRLAGKTADWETFDRAIRGLMTATMADLVRAGVLVAGPATAADPSARFAVFAPEEVSELVIALDHRVAEAEAGNAYVRYDVAKALEEQASRFVGDAPREHVDVDDLPSAPTERDLLELYVVCTNRPGPGVAFLIREAVEKADSEAWQDIGDAVVAAAEGAAEFVELEGAEGASYGPGIGADWHPHPGGGDLWRLGPFRPPADKREHAAVDEGRAEEG